MDEFNEIEQILGLHSLAHTKTIIGLSDLIQEKNDITFTLTNNGLSIFGLCIALFELYEKKN